ncbi:MAG TPA: Pvc16 family protein [Pyrinomonadaceae bacterium]|nr:Pvc16 family protein [Pyrinomonadaceae bacterium]
MSETLQAMLDDENLAASFPELVEAQVSFDRPSEQFSPSQTTVNLFLFDIRENMELRSNEPLIQRRNGEAVIRRALKRIDCSYLVTAWATGSTGQKLILDEHELLGQAMQVFMRYPTIPQNFLKGSLKEQELALPLRVGGTNKGEVKDPADFWSAIGNKLRPSLIVTITLELQVFDPEVAPFVSTQKLRVGLRDPEAETGLVTKTAEEVFRISGLVTDAKGKALAGAIVSNTETGMSATTDKEGRYALGMMPGGTYSLSVKAGKQSESFKVEIPAPAGKTYDLQLPG